MNYKIQFSIFKYNSRDLKKKKKVYFVSKIMGCNEDMLKHSNLITE
jgi:hypothetical protein